MHFFDSHAHVDLAAFADSESREDRLAEAAGAGVRAIVVPGIQPSNWGAVGSHASISGIKLYFGLGVHPYALCELPEAGDKELLDLLEHRLAEKPDRMVAVGECGLDHRESVLQHASRARQRALTAAQLGLAEASGLPVIVHCVQAHGALLDVLEAHQPEVDLVLHSYSGSAQLIDRYLRFRCFFSFSGAITSPRARRAVESAHRVPAERLLIETDAPDQVPHSRRAPNSPAYIVDVARAVAKARREPVADVARRTFENAIRVFQIDDSELLECARP